MCVYQYVYMERSGNKASCFLEEFASHVHQTTYCMPNTVQGAGDQETSKIRFLLVRRSGQWK